MMKMEENGFHPTNIMEVVFNIGYKGEKKNPSTGCIDYNFTKCSFRQWLQAELILEGEHYDYLLSLNVRNKKKENSAICNHSK
jgi:hypothetical protein